MSNRVRILIVEDEAVVYAEMRGHLQQLGYEVTGCVKNGAAALEHLASNRPDLVMIDIMLEGDMDGIELAQLINANFSLPFIYITAFSDQATIGRVKHTYPAGFVLKPFDELDLLAGVEIALYRHAFDLEVGSIKEQVTVTSDPVIDNSIFIKDKHRLVRVDLADILYVEAYDNYTRVHCSTERHISRGSLTSLVDRLGALGFIRVHRSFMVNASLVTSLDEKEVHLGDIKVPVSRGYRPKLVQAMKLL